MSRGLSLVVLAILAVAVVLARPWEDGGATSGGGSPREAPVPGTVPGPAPGGAREPGRATDGIPGGGLAAHERAGGHTLARHVGKTAEDLQARAEREGKREVSSFPDEATADRAVGEVLRRRKDAVARWLASSPRGTEDFEARMDFDAGTVWRTGAARVVPGRTVRVVLVPSDRFDAGYRIVTAYVTLP